jgi:hypothetical protein
MFTLEESAHLGFMLRVVATVAAAILTVLLCAEAVHWLHAHHRTLLLRHM